MAVSDTLNKAADLIELHGLARGQFVDSIGRIDVQEALFQAATGVSQDFYDKCKNKGIEFITLDQHNKWRWAVLSFREWLRNNKEVDQLAYWSDRLPEDVVISALRECAKYKKS